MKESRGPSAGRPSKAKKSGMTKVTPRTIAYAAVLVSRIQVSDIIINWDIHYRAGSLSLDRMSGHSRTAATNSKTSLIRFSRPSMT